MQDRFNEPEWMRHILAKSPDRSEGDEAETLARHTWLVLFKVAELAKLRPTLPEVVGEPDFWHLLYWSCFLHDFGKAAGGFQKQLQQVSWNGHRHEVVSLGFADWLLQHFPEEQQIWIVAAVASHHRDADSISEKYYLLDTIAEAWSSFDQADIPHMWRWLVDCGNRWISDLELDQLGVRSLDFQTVTIEPSVVFDQATKRIKYWLKIYKKFVRNELDKHSFKYTQTLILLRGLLITADHAASAHLTHLPAPIQLAWQELSDRILQGTSYQPYAHQIASAAAFGRSALLIAPTGSGKTEAALYWAIGDGSQSIARIFYALPYQASMNAMYDRLQHDQKGFGKPPVGIQHGSALQAVYLRLLESDEPVVRKKTRAAAKWEENINSLHARPIKVFSPYQMLKAMFQIKGFEAMLADYAQAAFIFDEIHAYDPDRLALIITLVRYLREHFAARFFVMSATFPDLIREKLFQALAIDQAQVITASDALFKQFARHRLVLVAGEVVDPANIERICEDFRAGKQVLVCANTVRRAQEVQRLLRQQAIPESQLILIHSRFTKKDRSALEESVMQRTQLGLTYREPLVLVATQVVEVSLNIDLDTIYSEPAPLEALLQRFGRVNRELKKGICPVHVFRQPTDGQGIYGRSKHKDLAGRIVQVTLAELEQHNGEIIDEASINDWLNTIYADSIILEQWAAKYNTIVGSAQDMMDRLRPFNSNKTTQQDFNKLFDSIELVPASLLNEYMAYLDVYDFIEASRLMVSISYQKFGQFSGQDKIKTIEHEHLKYKQYCIDLPYDSHQGLQFDVYAVDDLWE